jgi:hypothetical protein
MNKGLHRGLQGALVEYVARRQAKVPDSVADNRTGLHMVDMCSQYYMRYSHCIQNMAIAVLHAFVEVSLQLITEREKEGVYLLAIFEIQRIQICFQIRKRCGGAQPVRMSARSRRRLYGGPSEADRGAL